MSPSLALLLCIIFVLGIFILDSRRKYDVSPALWIPSVWFMLIASRLVSQWLNLGTGVGSAAAIEEGSPLDRATFSLLIISGIIVLLNRKIDWQQVLRNNVWVLLLFAYGGISIFWSDFPFVSFKRWIKGIGNLVMILIVLTDQKPVEAVKTLLRRSAYVLLPLSIVLIKYFPHLGRTFEIWSGIPYDVGVTTSKNMLGNLCLIIGYFFSWDLFTAWRKRKKNIARMEILLDILYLHMAVWLLLRSKSATSLATFFMGILIILVLEIPIVKKNMNMTELIGVFIIVMVLFIEWNFNLSHLIITGLGRDVTLTGRTDLWEMLLNRDNSLLFGAG
jgi:O-antigen ligase